MTLPPALSANIHFTPEHWDRQKRGMTKYEIRRITKVGDGDHVEIVLKGPNGPTGDLAFMRRADEIDQAGLHANSKVFLETIKGAMVTGLFVPEKGWAFRMTSAELAAQARERTEAIYNTRVATLEKNRAMYEDTEAALPDWLKARIEHFRSVDQHSFELNGWAYELVICTIAAAIDAGKPKQELDQIAEDMTASTNQLACASAIAAGKQEHGESFALAVPAGMAPITGRPDYRS